MGIYNTSTKEINADNNLDKKSSTPLKGDASTPKPLPMLRAGKATYYGDVDTQYIEGLDDGDLAHAQNLSASAQGWLTKTHRTLGKAATQGLYNAIDPVVSGIGWALDKANVNAGETLMGLKEDIRVSLNDKAQVHEKELGEDATFADELLRYSTLGSIVESATEFGVMGMGVGALTKGAGALALNAGVRLKNIAKAQNAANKVSKALTAKAGKAVQTAGRHLEGKVVYGRTIFGNKITSGPVINGLATNQLEGRMMAEEAESELISLYSPLLHNSEVTQDVKDAIRKHIKAAGDQIQFYNTALAFTDMIGFSRLLPFGKGGNKTGFWKYLKDNVKLLSLTEGAEEFVQNIIQSDAEFQHIQGIEEEVKKLHPNKIPGLEYKDTGKSSIADETLLWQINPEKALESYLAEVGSTSDYLKQLGSSRKAWIEAISGVVGGGPQWVITGAPSAVSNYKQNEENARRDAEFIANTKKSYQDFIQDDLLNEASLNETIDELTNKFQGTDKEFIKDIVEEYALAKVGINAVKNGRDDALRESLKETQKEIQEMVATGDLSQEEFNKYTERLTKIEDVMSEYENLRTYSGSDELYERTLNKIALEKARDVTSTAGKKAATILKSISGRQEEMSFEEFLEFSGMDDKITPQPKEKTPTQKEVPPVEVEEEKKEAPVKEAPTQEVPKKAKPTPKPKTKAGKLGEVFKANLKTIEEAIDEENTQILRLKSFEGQATARERENRNKLYTKFENKINATKSLRALSNVSRSLMNRKREDGVSIVEGARIDKILDLLKAKRKELNSIEKSKSIVDKVSDNIQNRKNKVSGMELEDEGFTPSTPPLTVEEKESGQTVDDLIRGTEEGAIMKSSKASAEYVKANLEKAQSGLETMMRSISKAEDDSAIPTEDSIQAERKRRLDAMSLVTDFIRKIPSMRADGKIPGYQEVVNMFEEAGGISDLAKEGLQIYYSKVPKDFVGEKQTGRTPIEVDDSQYLLDPNMLKVKVTLPFEHTVQSYFLTIKGIAWDSDVIKDWDRVKKGSKLEYHVLTPTEIRAREEELMLEAEESGEDFYGLISIGGEANKEPLETMFYDTYLQALKDGTIDRELYSEANMTPIRVYLNEDGDSMPAGWVHTVQWIRRERDQSTRAALTAADVEFATESLRQFRTSILDRAGEDRDIAVKGVVTGRKENIRLESGSLYGTAIERNYDNPSRSKDILVGDNLLYSVLAVTEEQQSRWVPQDMQGLLKNKTLVVPDYIKKDPLSYAGSPVVLLPSEDTEFVYLERLGTDQLTQDDFSIIRDLVSDLDNTKVDGTFDKLHKAYSGSIATPSRVKALFESLVYAGKSKTTKPSTVKFNISFTDSAATSLEDKKNNATKQMANVKPGERVALGDLSINIKLGSKIDETIKYRFFGKKGSKKGGKNSYEYVLASKEGKRSTIKQVLNTLMEEGTDLPYYNIQHYTLMNSLRKKNSGSLRMSPKGVWEYNQVDGVKDMLLERTYTYLTSPTTLSKGKKTYFTNTVITSSLDEASSEDTKRRVEREKGDARTEKEKADFKYIQKVINENKLKLLQYRDSLEDSQHILEFFEASKNPDGTYDLANFPTKSVQEQAKNLLLANGESDINNFIKTVKKEITTAKSGITKTSNKISKYKKAKVETVISTGHTVQYAIKGAKNFLYDVGVLHKSKAMASMEKVLMELYPEIKLTFTKDGVKRSNIKAGTVLIDAVHQKADTLPYEYAHHYIAWNRDTAIVQEAIKKWGSEEALVQAIGEQAVKQEGKAWEWWNKFVTWLLGDLSKLTKLKKEHLRNILTDAFLVRQNLAELKPLKRKPKPSESFIREKAILNKYGVHYVLKNNSVSTDINNFKTFDQFFTADEAAKISKSIQNIFYTKYLDRHSDGITYKEFIGLQVESKAAFRAHLEQTGEEIKLYKKHLDSSDTDPKAEIYTIINQYLKGVQTIENAFKERSNNLNTRLEDLFTVGFDKAAAALGYPIFTSFSKELRGISEKSMFEGVLEDGTSSDDNIKDEVVYSKHARLRKDPSAKLTARLKAKLNVLYSRTSDNEIESNIFGSPEYATNVYTALLDIFSSVSNTNYAAKYSLLQEKVAAIKNGVNKNKKEFFLTQLLDQLNGDDVYNYSDLEKREFNVVLNKQKLDLRTLKKLSKSNKLISVSANYSETFSQTSRRLNSMFSDMHKNRDLKLHINQLLGNDLKRNLKLGVGVKTVVDDVDYTYDNKHLLSQQNTFKLLEILNEFDKNVKVDKVSMDTFNKVEELRSQIARITALRTSEILMYLEVPIEGDVIDTIQTYLKEDEKVPLINLYGLPENDTIKFSSALTDFLVRINENLNNSDKTKYLSNTSRSFINVLFAEDLMKVKSIMSRVGNKLISNYADPTHTSQIFNKLHDINSSYLDKFDTDVYAKNSVIKSILQNPKEYPAVHTQKLFSSPEQGNVLSTWLSDVDNSDSPMVHTVLGLGNYLESIEFGAREEVAKKVLDYKLLQSGQEVSHQIKTRIAKFRLPTISNKDASLSSTGLDLQLRKIVNNSFVYNEPVLNFYIDAVITPEINTIVKTKSYDTSDTYNGGLLYSLPKANTERIHKLIDALDPAISVNSLFATDPYSNRSDNEVYASLRSLIIEETKKHFDDSINGELEMMVKNRIIYRTKDGRFTGMNDKLSKIREFDGMSTRAKEGNLIFNSDKLKEVLYNRAAGQGLFLANYHQLVATSIANYFKEHPENKDVVDSEEYNPTKAIAQTYNNVGKRLAKEIAPGIFPEGSRKLKILVFEDLKRDSKWYTEENGYSDIGSADILDGSAFTTTDTRLEQMEILGQLDSSLLNDVKNFYEETSDVDALGDELKNKLAAVILKPRIVGTYQDSIVEGTQEVITKPIYVKYAESVLNSPKLDTNPLSITFRLNKLLKEASEDGEYAVIAVPSSSYKVGQPAELLNLDKLEPNESGEYIISDKASVITTFEDWAIQLNTAFKPHKQNTPSGQVENIAMSALSKTKKLKLVHTGKKPILIRKYYEDIIDELSQIYLDRVKVIFSSTSPTDAYTKMNSIGSQLELEFKDLYEQGALGKLSPDFKLSNLIKAAVSTYSNVDKAQMNPNILEWIRVDAEGNFVNDIQDSLYYNTYLNIIKTTVEKATVKAKIAGKQLLLEPQTIDLRTAGMNDNSVILFDFMLEGDNLDKATGELRPHLPEVNGEGRPAQILTSFNMTTVNGGKVNLKDYIITKNGRRVIDSSRLPKELLETIAYRTPTQGHNMMSYAQVVGFLPEANKGAIQGPNEFIALMGLDFDADKLFLYDMYLREYEDDDGITKIEVIKEPITRKKKEYRIYYLRNEKIRTIQTILNDPDVIKNHTAKKLEETENFEEFIKEIQQLRNVTDYTDGSISYFSPLYQEEKRNGAVGGLDSTAIHAILLRTSALLHVNPMPVFVRDEYNNLKQKSLRLGDAYINKFGGGRPNVFEKSQGVEADFDLPKNNISTAVTFSVDDENLHILGKLGMTDDSRATNKNFSDHIFTLNSVMMLAGFKLKTAVAVSNLPLFNSYITGKTISYEQLEEAYKKSTGKTRITKTNSEHLSILKKIDKRKVNELEFIDDLNALNRRLQQNHKTLDKLSETDLLDAMRLINFKDDLIESYNNTVGKFKWLVNLDSKGFAFNLSDVTKKYNNLKNPRYTEVLSELFKIKELEINKNYFLEYNNQLKALTKHDKYSKKVYDILDEAGVITDAMYDIQKYIRSEKYRAYKPNVDSLIDRILALKLSKEEKVRKFVSTNPFLSKLYANDSSKTITFAKDTVDSDSVIMSALEELNVEGELAGVNLKTLHKDLVYHSITDRRTSYGDTYLPYVPAKYYKQVAGLEAQQLESKLDLERVAAYIGYKNLEAVKEDSFGVSMWKEEELNQETDEYEFVIKYIKDKVVLTFKEEDVEDFENPQDKFRIDTLVDPINSNIEQLGDGAIGLITKTKDTLERLMSSSAMVPFKKFYSTVFAENPVPVELYLTGNYPLYADNKIGLAGDSLEEIRTALVHEGTHSVLMKTLEYYRDKTLKQNFPLDTARELKRIFDNLRDARKSVIDTIGKEYVNRYKKEYRGKSTNLNWGIESEIVEPFKLAYGVLEADSRVLEYDLWSEALPADVLDQLVTLGRTKAYARRLGYLNHIYNGLYSYKKEEGKPTAIHIETTKGEVQGLYMEADREVFYDVIREEVNYEKTLRPELSDMEAMMALLDRSEDHFKENKEEAEAYVSYLYGLTNLHEFTSSAYAVGTSKTPLSPHILGYSETAEYESILNSPLSPKLQGVLADAFNLIKDLVRAILGPFRSNAIFSDIMYAKTLIKQSSFIKVNKPLNEVEYTDNAGEILNLCK